MYKNHFNKQNGTLKIEIIKFQNIFLYYKIITQKNI
jgi:hypothetical protein